MTILVRHKDKQNVHSLPIKFNSYKDPQFLDFMTKFFRQNFEKIFHKKDLKIKQEILKFESQMKEAVENEKRN